MCSGEVRSDLMLRLREWCGGEEGEEHCEGYEQLPPDAILWTVTRTCRVSEILVINNYF